MPRRKKLGREGGREGDRHKTERVNEKAVCRWGGGGGGEGGKEGGREGGRKGGKEGGREGGRKGEREGERASERARERGGEGGADQRERAAQGAGETGTGGTRDGIKGKEGRNRRKSATRITTWQNLSLQHMPNCIQQAFLTLGDTRARTHTHGCTQWLRIGQARQFAAAAALKHGRRTCGSRWSSETGWL